MAILPHFVCIWPYLAVFWLYLPVFGCILTVFDRIWLYFDCIGRYWPYIGWYWSVLAVYWLVLVGIGRVLACTGPLYWPYPYPVPIPHTMHHPLPHTRVPHPTTGCCPAHRSSCPHRSQRPEAVHQASFRLNTKGLIDIPVAIFGVLCKSDTFRGAFHPDFRKSAVFDRFYVNFRVFDRFYAILAQHPENASLGLGYGYT